MKMNDVLQKTLTKIKFSSKEIKGFEKIAKDFILDLKKKGIVAYLGGSLAKGTLVKSESFDIDIFVVFNEESEMLKLEKILRSIILKIYKIKSCKSISLR